MIKRIFAVILVAALIISLLGCSQVSNLTKGGTTSSPPPGPEIVRKAELGTKWQMTQMRIKLDAGDELPVLLKLADGDAVDGYFFLEKGTNVDFQVSGDSLIYRSKKEGADSSEGISSDRFTFTASKAQGSTYSLTLRNTAAKGVPGSDIAVFLEVILPATGSIFTPLESK